MDYTFSREEYKSWVEEQLRKNKDREEPNVTWEANDKNPLSIKTYSLSLIDLEYERERAEIQNKERFNQLYNRILQYQVRKRDS